MSKILQNLRLYPAKYKIKVGKSAFPGIILYRKWKMGSSLPSFTIPALLVTVI